MALIARTLAGLQPARRQVDRYVMSPEVTRKLFSDSPELLMTRLLEGKGLSEAQLRSLRALVDERLKARGDE